MGGMLLWKKCYNGNIHKLIWGVCTKDKEDLINKFSVGVHSLKGGDIIWTCGNDNIIRE